MDVMIITQPLQDRSQRAEIGQVDEFVQRRDHESRLVVGTKAAQRVHHVIRKPCHDLSMMSP